MLVLSLIVLNTLATWLFVFALYMLMSTAYRNTPVGMRVCFLVAVVGAMVNGLSPFIDRQPKPGEFHTWFGTVGAIALKVALAMGFFYKNRMYYHTGRFPVIESSETRLKDLWHLPMDWYFNRKKISEWELAHMSNEELEAAAQKPGDTGYMQKTLMWQEATEAVFRLRSTDPAGAAAIKKALTERAGAASDRVQLIGEEAEAECLVTMIEKDREGREP